MRYAELIDQYAIGGQKLADAVRGLRPEDLQAHPDPGKWSIQQVVIHIMDSDLVATDRMKRTIAEDNPTLLAYDQEKFAARLFYDEQPVDQVVALFELNRKVFANVLRRLPETAFARFGTHSERGRLTLAQQLEGYIKHLEHHLKFIREKRERLTKDK